MEIILSNDELTTSTDGLSSELGYEISATVDDITLIDECRRFVLFVANYVLKGRKIKPEETLAYGYWITKVRLEISGRLNFWEYRPDAREYVPGISNTLRYWREQHEVCNAIGSVFSPPNAEQLITVSEGVFEGDDVQGVRYRSPSHMSGWWITTDRYNGALSSLKNVHESATGSIQTMVKSNSIRRPLTMLGSEWRLAYPKLVEAEREIFRPTSRFRLS
ncbi:hypothetical protein [Massilia sp. Root418]|jgi:hypothetical protein|uniref:immunity protein Imm33 domain-containing protein n=1 Tax=Massilia sp. Root418 TaxID=1736532 RepID=UPI000A58AB6E|nr:hypothetical protein [Massilia sp. Root418]